MKISDYQVKLFDKFQEEINTSNERSLMEFQDKVISLAIEEETSQLRAEIIELQQRAERAEKRAEAMHNNGLFEAAVNWLDKRNSKNEAEDENEYLLACDLFTEAESNLANVTSAILDAVEEV